MLARRSRWRMPAPPWRAVIFQPPSPTQSRRRRLTNGRKTRTSFICARTSHRASTRRRAPWPPTPCASFPAAFACCTPPRKYSGLTTIPPAPPTRCKPSTAWPACVRGLIAMGLTSWCWAAPPCASAPIPRSSSTSCTTPRAKPIPPMPKPPWPLANWHYPKAISNWPAAPFSRR